MLKSGIVLRKVGILSVLQFHYCPAQSRNSHFVLQFRNCPAHSRNSHPWVTNPESYRYILGIAQGI